MTKTGKLPIFKSSAAAVAMMAFSSVAPAQADVAPDGFQVTPGQSDTLLFSGVSIKNVKNSAFIFNPDKEFIFYMAALDPVGAPKTTPRVELLKTLLVQPQTVEDIKSEPKQDVITERPMNTSDTNVLDDLVTASLPPFKDILNGGIGFTISLNEVNSNAYFGTAAKIIYPQAFKRTAAMAGTRGDARLVQIMLKQIGLYNGYNDDAWGVLTQGGLETFASNNGLLDSLIYGEAEKVEITAEKDSEGNSIYKKTGEITPPQLIGVKEKLLKALANIATRSIYAEFAHPSCKLSHVFNATPESCIALSVATYRIADWEKLRTNPYFDAVGKKTVCYGETNITMKAYTAKECKSMLIHSVADYYQAALESIDRPIPPSTQIAMTMFSYNLGKDGFTKSPVRELLTEGDIESSCTRLERYNKGTIKGKKVVLGGLVRRRAEEKNVCMFGLRESSSPAVSARTYFRTAKSGPS